MPIRIATDINCELPQEPVDEHGITVVPMYIRLGIERRAETTSGL